MKSGFPAKIILLLSTAVLVSGCWGHKDINKRLLPVVLGVREGKEEAYNVLLRIPIPGTASIRSIEQESRTIGKAVDKIKSNAEQGLDLSHIKLLLIDESVAKKGINSIIDYTMRSKELTLKSLVAIVSGDSESLMRDQRRMTVGTVSFDFFSKEAGWTPSISIVHIWEAFRDIHTDTRDMAIPIISRGKDTLYQLEGAAIMQRDRMVAKISAEETIIYNLFQGKFVGGTIEVMNHATVVTDQVTVSNRASWDASSPKMRFTLKVIATVEEKKGNPTDEEIKKELEQLIKTRFQTLMKTLQDHKSDALGLGRFFRNKLSEEQKKRWKTELFPKLEYDTIVEVTIRNTENLK